MHVASVAAADADLTVRSWGAEHGRPLVYWHGLNRFAALHLNEAGPAWADRGLRVVAIAGPGAGDSPPLADPEAYRATRLADLVVAVADRLDLGRFSFLGWSWGASIGVHLATRHRDRLTALALRDGGHTDVVRDKPRDELARELAEQQARFTFADWDAFVAAVPPRVWDWRPALEERFRAGLEERDGRLVIRADPEAAAWALAGIAAEPPSAVHAALGAGGLPVLLLRAEHDDDTEQLAAFRAAVPQAEVHTLHSRHDLLADAPAETIRLVGDWLAGSPGARAG